ncbi:hypothetical protein BH24PSE2_BH24PSE2_17720 [soil metagenome]
MDTRSEAAHCAAHCPLGRQVMRLAAAFLSLCLAGVAHADDAAAESADSMTLDATSITGNQELPKVLYIVPWKKPLAGDLPAPPVSALLEEVLAPVDREVFRRHVRYFEALDEGEDEALVE